MIFLTLVSGIGWFASKIGLEKLHMPDVFISRGFSNRFKPVLCSIDTRAVGDTLNISLKRKEKKMSIEESKALVRRWFEEVYNKGNLSVADEVLSSEVITHHHGLKGVTEDVSTPEDNKKFRIDCAGAFPDMHFNINDIIAEGDKFAIHFTFTGTHKGKFWGHEPTNKKIRFALISIYRVIDGKIKEATHPTGWWRHLHALLSGEAFKEQEES